MEAKHISGSVYTPIPPYPLTARQNIEQGFGVVRIVCDSTGKVATATMIHSTGYDDLDQNVLIYARAHWHDQPNTSFRVPVDYRLSGAHSAPVNAKTSADGWSTPMPHYPQASVKFQESGSGVVKVVTDTNGRVIKAEMTKSTGKQRLDDATIEYAIGLWRGPRNSSREVAVDYVMKSAHF